jgi:dienelactone hydrolase
MKIIYPFLIFLIIIIPDAGAKEIYGKFYDTERDRSVPYKVYYPDTLKGEYPVIIFSHGLGGSVEAAVYLGGHLSQNGYICFHIQHYGSDESVWAGAKTRIEIIRLLKKSIKDLSNAVNRFNDIPFVVNEIIKLNINSGVFKGHLDTNSIGIIGHSYGARSVLIAAGEKLAKGKFSFKEPRIKAGVSLSPNLPDNPPDDLIIIYKDIDIPLFHITGTEDGDPLNRSEDFTPENRTIPYKNINGSAQYLLVLNKATHMTFNGTERLSNDDPHFKEHIESVKKGVTAFLNYYLKKSESDGKYLKNDYKKSLDTKDRFEWKDKK